MIPSPCSERHASLLLCRVLNMMSLLPVILFMCTFFVTDGHRVASTRKVAARDGAKSERGFIYFSSCCANLCRTAVITAGFSHKRHAPRREFAFSSGSYFSSWRQTRTSRSRRVVCQPKVCQDQSIPRAIITSVRAEMLDHLCAHQLGLEAQAPFQSSSPFYLTFVTQWHRI